MGKEAYLTAEDLAELKQLHINMALDTNDREWFQSLTNEALEGSK
ncbi:IDEAL domain-containing protein [Pseudobacillus wudalianchiensis]|nr:IDEAL domain-containing protein [Bacillus wudalianchiensis]